MCCVNTTHISFRVTEQRTRAEELTKQVNGVKRVHNNLQVRTAEPYGRQQAEEHAHEQAQAGRDGDAGGAGAGTSTPMDLSALIERYMPTRPSWAASDFPFDQR